MKRKLISNLLEKKIKVSFLGCCVATVLCSSFYAYATKSVVTVDGNTEVSNIIVNDTKDEFVLNSASWLSIKLYAENSLELPITENLMRHSFALPKKENFTQFQDLLETYKDIHETADHWNRTVYPEIISHAHDLKNYASLRDKFLDPITKSLATFFQTQSESDRKNALAYITLLKKYTENSRDKSGESLQHLTDFNADITQQIAQLQLLDEKYSELSLLGTEQLEKDLVRFHKTINQLHDQYHHNVVVAATTPTYAWIPVYGWISAPIVAGVYGSKAVKVKAHIEELEKDIESTNVEIKYKKKVVVSYKNAHLSLTKVSKDTSIAKSKIEALNTAWMSLHADLEHAVELLNNASGENGIKHAEAGIAAHLTQFQFEQVRGTWRTISSKAEKFAKYAYTDKRR